MATLSVHDLNNLCYLYYGTLFWHIQIIKDYSISILAYSGQIRTIPNYDCINEMCHDKLSLAHLWWSDKYMGVQFVVSRIIIYKFFKKSMILRGILFRIMLIKEPLHSILLEDPQHWVFIPNIGKSLLGTFKIIQQFFS